MGPLRPVLTVSGPGTSGGSTVTFDITGGVPDGITLAMACPVGFIGPVDVTYALPTFLLVTPFDLSQTRRASAATPILLDSSGAGSFQIFNSGGLSGLMGWQFLVGNGANVLLGSTDVAYF